jgi:putative restriction endonuclease
MTVHFNDLIFGQAYERPLLARLWGYQSFHALSKGVVTPAGTKFIIFFVTKEKQETLTQYNDYIDGNMLFWEGEEKHSSDKRVVEASKNSDEIHLFYREVHHTPFVYYQLRENAPSEFVFRIEALSSEIDAFREVREYAAEYNTLAVTEQEQIVISRLGQGNFRRNVIRLWGSCSVTGLQTVSLLRASHIKPWKDSANNERLTPYNGLLLIPDYDFLFDRGYISFKNSGNVVVSQRLSPFARKVFDVRDDLQLRKVFPESKAYLEFHRSQVFE